MGNSGRGHADDQPFFFLSYAHTPRQDQDDQTDPDYWVRQLFLDLSQHVREMLGHPHGADPGFMDRELRPGKEWPAALAEALATCRVFVPLYSRRYFASVHCGKEWSAFARRAAGMSARGAESVEAIIPALWVPVPPEQLPEAARHVSAGFTGAYAEHGFYGIMKLTRYRDDYEAAAYQLARQIVDTGLHAPLPPGPVEKYDRLENAFGAAYPAGDGERSVLVTVAALDASNRAHGGSDAYYGETPRQWTPYPGESGRPLAEAAADLATSLGYLPEVGGLAEHASELLSQEPTRAMVLIIDPWAATVPESRDILRQIDNADNPWITVVVAWNPKDSRAAAEEDRLKSALEAALPHKLVEGGRATSALAIRGVPTLADFAMVVPGVLRAAERSFLRFAPGSAARDPAVKRHE